MCVRAICPHVLRLKKDGIVLIKIDVPITNVLVELMVIIVVLQHGVSVVVATMQPIYINALFLLTFPRS